ncbi:TonB-dependent receptor [Hymenobacter terrenus]|uniref:TonB-dependent receptor n=1 Tax=Hymenobacter terrenus TaxID=1629124 RepID=UPI0018CE1CCC|nr:TonB-dependent receptor [Hymenobacter terrenus]
MLFILSGLAQRTQAQTTVSGTVLDQAGQLLAFATAVLLQLPDSAIANSQTTTEQGAYAFASVPPGRYCVKALLLSYASARSAAFAVAPGDHPVMVPPLRLTTVATALKEVTVQGRPPVLEQHADRTVLNVDRLSTAGDNALEVLKKAPGVQLDKDDHLIYRGSAGINVLIDGKLTYMSGEALTSYLKSLPASAISQIELIPNPPASMDAAGTAGVLNIRLRRNQLPGLNGTATVSAGYGRYEKGSAGTNLTYNVGKVRLFTRLDAGRYNSFNRLVLVRHIRDTTFEQVNYWRPLSQDLNYTVGADFALTARHTLGVQLRGSTGKTTAQTTSESNATDAAGRLRLDNPQVGHDANFGLNLNYCWALDSAGRELTTDADYVRYTTDKNQRFSNVAFGPDSEQAQDAGQLRSAQSSEVTIRALKADYVHPFAGTAWRAEAGAKISWVTTRSAIQFDQLRAAEWQLDPLRTNQFQYDETISAAYFSLSITLGHLELKGGLRGEQTHSLGESATTSQRVPRDYFQLFPSLFASYKFSEQDQLGVSVSRRITRPAYHSLNPFLFYTDAYTALQGNPFLAPSLSRSFVLNYLHRDFQVLSLSYLLETNAMNQVVYQDDQTKVTTSIPQNLDRAVTFSLTSGGHTDITKWWGTDNQLIGSYNEVQSRIENRPVRLTRFAWSASSEHTFTLPRHFKLQVDGNYNSPSVYGLFNMKASGSFNLGLKKQLWADKATLSLKMRDLFYTDRFRSSVVYNNVNMTWNNQYESRRLTLTFTCKLGSGKTQARRAVGTSDEEGRVGH